MAPEEHSVPDPMSRLGPRAQVLPRPDESVRNLLVAGVMQTTDAGERRVWSVPDAATRLPSAALDVGIEMGADIGARCNDHTRRHLPSPDGTEGAR